MNGQGVKLLTPEGLGVVAGCDHVVGRPTVLAAQVVIAACLFFSVKIMFDRLMFLSDYCLLTLSW